MNKTLTFLILFAASAWSVSVRAVWYQVEVIVFENLTHQSDGELWYKSPGLVQLEDSVVLRQVGFEDIKKFKEQAGNSSSIDMLIPYTLLPKDNYRLNGIYRVMRLSREYRPLYHISWQQPGLDGNGAKPVHLQSEDASSLYEITMPATLVTDPMPVEFYEPIELIIDGTLKIRSNLYLYVDMDMVLFRQPPIEEESGMVDDMLIDDFQGLKPVMTPIDYVRLTESRRIKLNELHYFDHPMFGVIIQVSRYGPE